ncbi:hypothetical protein SARC_08488 [Sphaeroforma arctica JP610]|uniref:Uncharacterized protein n=1 Tax=Sphaeroforma arctica JP610 TaxID=667725 RepID=A0A0L0FT39_9EUKA|nr:hypothetical protein SARC_08488 [Sphaeroforma arctica JP610]KNC79103.1 hypothetical protein SARC_08488 [Sphaeroforma arctica JP610]|eukprot:XP_014153005.1 hypothetical protein SARC_08488 [Sphaeroforma arctica JP610]
MDSVEDFKHAPMKWKVILAIDLVVLLSDIILMAVLGPNIDSPLLWVYSATQGKSNFNGGFPVGTDL